MLYTLSVLAFFLCACAALVSGDVVFTRSAAPPGWQLGSRADVGASVRLQFGLKQQNLDVLDAKFWAVSDPKSPEYQNFMTIEAISAIVAPKAEDVTLIKNWLFQHGVKETEIKSLAGDSLEVVTTVQVAENLFETQFYQYVNTKSKKTLLRQFGPLSVPSDVMDRLDLIDGVSQFPPPVNGRYGHRVNDNADNGVVAQSIWSLYNIGTQSATIPISSGVAEFQGETFSPSWLASYGPLAGITIAPLTANHIVGTNTGGGETEADLDIQMIASVNTVATNWFWIEDNDGWLWSFATHFFNTTDVPLVISISYGWWEGDQCRWDQAYCTAQNITSDQYTHRVNTEFQKIGLRGVSLVVSSGDSGAHTRTDPGCTATTLRADFPGASPYVTSVGATEIQTGTVLTNPPPACKGYSCWATGLEVTVNVNHTDGWASGGGFSEVEPMPSYQTAAVNAYLKSGVTLPPSSYFDPTKRAHPDVAAVGHHCLIYEGNIEAVDGTSCSAPIVGAILSLLNEASLASSGKPLGFANPLLYQAWTAQPTAFNDVTIGDNICCEGGCGPTCKGYLAAKGWDPVTGLGTPNYAVLLKYIQSLHSQRKIQSQ